MLAECCERNNNYPAAVFAYKKLITYESDKWDHYYNAGLAYDNQKDSKDSAMAYFYKAGTKANAQAVNFKDVYNNPWYKLFALAKEQNHTDYYITSYDNMKKIAPYNFPKTEDEQYYNLLKELNSNPNAETYSKFGDFLTNSKRYNDAIKKYEKSIEMNPSGKTAVTKKIIQCIKDDAYYTYFDKREYEKSLLRYEDALKYTTSDPEIYSALGTICMDKLTTPDYKKATEYYQKALPLTTGQMEKKDILENIGLCYEKQKDYTNAITYYNKVVALGPNFAKSAHYKLARVYDAKGDAAQALQHRKLSN
jgi:tetratricopeptide (TPR) repeat protein